MKTSGKFYLKNDALLDSSSLELIDFDIVDSIYEVIRVVEGVPLFIEKHLERFNHSSVLAGLCKSFDINNITNSIVNLSHKNKVHTGNIKLVNVFDKKSVESNEGELYIFFIPHHYPEIIDYQQGVRLIPIIAERPNPNAKIHHSDLRNKANVLIDNENVFEVLLINENGFVTEGSRSNIFFIKHNKVFTPPSNVVLPGITRNVVIQICKSQQIDFEEKMVLYDELNTCNSTFITGTSPKVLPVSGIDNLNFDPQNEILQRIRQIYDTMMLEYIRNFKSGIEEGK